jgi:spore germination protein GerM
VVLSLALVLVGVVAGCGVPEDREPQVLGTDAVPPGLLTTPSTTTQPSEVPPERQAELYFVNADGQVTPELREVEDQSDNAVLQALLGTDPTSLAGGLTTNIPPETALLNTSFDNDEEVLTVDLSEEFQTIRGEGAIAAVAQIVFTATEDDPGRAVAFQVEGDPYPVQDEEGVVSDDPVTRSDYASLLAP